MSTRVKGRISKIFHQRTSSISTKANIRQLTAVSTVSPLDVSGYCDDVVREYADYQESKVRDVT